MSKFKPYDRQQQCLFPNSIEDFIPEGHLARIIDEIVEGFNTNQIESKYSENGQKSYHPKILLKVLFYGYTTGIRSGRKISAKCESDTAYMYLSCMYKPDFRTINDFRKDNIKEVEYFFLEILKICRELGMIKVGELYIDGSKIRANASKKRTKNKKEYEKWLAKIENEIKTILQEAEETDIQEDEEYGESRGDELPGRLVKKKALKEKVKEVMEAMDKKDKEKVNLTDTQAKNIKSGGLIKPNYNCQAGVTEDGIIVGGYVTNNASDSGELIEVLDQSECNTRESFEEVIADSGYGTYEAYEELEGREKMAYIPDQSYSKEQKQKYKGKINAYDKSKFVYDKEKDEYFCPKGKKLIYKCRSKEDNRQYKIYKGIECQNCKDKRLCTKAKARMIKREEREELREKVIARLKTKEGQEKYNKRNYKIEPIFGHLKHNLKYRMFHLRGLEKVNGEFKLMCIAHNLTKIHKYINELEKAA